MTLIHLLRFCINVTMSFSVVLCKSREWKTTVRNVLYSNDLMSLKVRVALDALSMITESSGVNEGTVKEAGNLMFVVSMRNG